MKYALLLLSSICLASLAHAQSPQINPVVFTRSTVTIVSSPIPAEKEEDKKGDDKQSDEKSDADKDNKASGDDKNAKENPEKPAAPTEKVKHYFNVEVRSPSALKMEWFFSLDTLKEKEGMMITYDYPQQFMLEPNKIYKPLDVLFIDDEGTIKAIAPNIVLSNITKPLQPDSPMKAMLFLKGGTTEENGIAPGDRVVHGAFIASPVILN